MKPALLLALFLSLSGSTSAQDASWNAGLAKAIITPET